MSGRVDADHFAAGARYDVAVAGGGAVGATLACALADSGARVLLADPWSGHAEASPAFAPRPLALSLASQRVLAALGAWEALAPGATPIESIHVSEAGRFGAARLEAAECGVGRFGAVVAAGALGAVLRDAVARRSAIDRTGGRIVDACVCADRVVSRVVEGGEGSSSRRAPPPDGGDVRGSRSGHPPPSGYPTLSEGESGPAPFRASPPDGGDARGFPSGHPPPSEYPPLSKGESGPVPFRASPPDGGDVCPSESEHSPQPGGENGSAPFQASLLVVADGGRSPLRDALGIGTTVREYRQSAVATVVTARAPRAHTAFERFTPGGPVALLPMGGARYGLVWSCGEVQAEGLGRLSGRAFAEALDVVFAGRLGGFDAVGERAAFPLRLVRADAIVADRVALVGNAANHLHPVAGQGFNLGLRDVACLAEAVAAARREGSAPGDASVLERYRRWRAPDHAAVARFTDVLVDVFGHRFSPIAAVRAPALVALDLLPPLKRALARRAMGLAGRAPRLALGGLP